MIPATPTRSRFGFTLIELLVVISIIALLLAILMPALRNAKEMARGLTCMSKEKQFGIAMAAYGADFNGWLPQNPYSGNRSRVSDPVVNTAKCWDAQLSSYLNYDMLHSSSQQPVYHCSSGELLPGKTPGQSRGYYINAHVAKSGFSVDYQNASDDLGSRSQGANPINPHDGLQGQLGAIPEPSRLGVIFEGWISPDWGGSGYNYQEAFFGQATFNGEEWQNDILNSYVRTKDVTAYRHADSTNVLFADSHVELRNRPTDGFDTPRDVIWYWSNGVGISD